MLRYFPVNLTLAATKSRELELRSEILAPPPVNKSCGVYLPRAGGAREFFFFSNLPAGCCVPGTGRGPPALCSQHPPAPCKAPQRPPRGCGLAHGTQHFAASVSRLGTFACASLPEGPQPGRLPRIKMC